MSSYPSHLPAGAGEFPFARAASAVPPDRYWLHLLLLGLTLFTTTLAGARFALAFDANIPPFTDDYVAGFAAILASPARLAAGLPFSLTLLLILMAHEMGHYLACRYYCVAASLPYFLPIPTPIGTFGAFIHIRAPIYSKRALFDIGIAGPLAGFLFLVPALAIGLAYSKVIPGAATDGVLLFGSPLLERVLAAGLFPGVPHGDLYLHPIARAAWVGLLATALNLLPVGQLDGGHILYAFIGRHHRTASRIGVALLFLLGAVMWKVAGHVGWFAWAILLLLFGMRHPVIYDTEPLAPGRVALALLAAVIFVMSFSLVPISVAE